jgi:hypothetical protein
LERAVIRSTKLRKSAREAPYCFFCQQPNDAEGTKLCLAHSNELRHGRGASHKSNDIFGAILCGPCHDLADGRAGGLSLGEKRELMRFAHDRTLIWWVDRGLVSIG